MAGFEVTLHGRIWVTPEVRTARQVGMDSGQFALGPSTEYELIVDHFLPTEQAANFQLEAVTTGQVTAFITGPKLQIDSPYDRHWIRFGRCGCFRRRVVPDRSGPMDRRRKESRFGFLREEPKRTHICQNRADVGHRREQDQTWATSQMWDTVERKSQMWATRLQSPIMESALFSAASNLFCSTALRTDTRLLWAKILIFPAAAVNVSVILFHILDRPVAMFS